MNQPKFRTWFFAAAFALAAAVVVLVTLSLTTKPGPGAPQPGHGAQTVSEEDEVQDAAFEDPQGRWYGLCSKNSIHSIEDFRTTVAADPLLTSHFSAFQWDKARMGRLEKAIDAYVHFRKDGVIVRKNKPIKLPAGDGYITDGATRVRTFCCNSYSEASPASPSPAPPSGSLSNELPQAMVATPQHSASSDAPGQHTFKHPDYASAGGSAGASVSRRPLTGDTMTAPPDDRAGVVSNPKSAVTKGDASTETSTSGHPDADRDLHLFPPKELQPVPSGNPGGTVSVPEPTTLLLVGIGLVGLAGIRRMIRK